MLEWGTLEEMEYEFKVNITSRHRGRGIPRKDYHIYDQEENKIGIVTSGTMSPSIKKGIGLGYVNTINSKLGTSLNIEIRNKMVKASIVKIPFVKT